MYHALKNLSKQRTNKFSEGQSHRSQQILPNNWTWIWSSLLMFLPVERKYRCWLCFKVIPCLEYGDGERKVEMQNSCKKTGPALTMAAWCIHGSSLYSFPVLLKFSVKISKTKNAVCFCLHNYIQTFPWERFFPCSCMKFQFHNWPAISWFKKKKSSGQTQ